MRFVRVLADEVTDGESPLRLVLLIGLDSLNHILEGEWMGYMCPVSGGYRSPFLLYTEGGLMVAEFSKWRTELTKAAVKIGLIFDVDVLQGKDWTSLGQFEIIFIHPYSETPDAS